MEPVGGGGSSSTDPRSTYVLSNLAEVVERVFTFLPAKALLRVAGVCRLWRECVRRVLRTHRSVTWISAGVAEAGHLEGHCLVRVVAEALENVHILPRTVLYMADSETFISLEECRGHKRARKRTTMETAFALEKLFPKQCQILGIVTPGIIVTPMGSGNNRPQEIEIGESGFALLFPQIEGIKIRPFHFIKDPKNLTLERHQLAEVGLLDNPELRVVLVFGYNCCKVGANNYLQRVVSTFSNMNIILAGGQVDNLSSLTSEKKPLDIDATGVVGLSFSGQRIQSATVLLSEDVTDDKTAEAAMQRLKAANIPEENTIGFMFACVGRGFQYYRAKGNVEADAFRKFFPSVPLFGFFGNGEIGCDRIVTGNFILRRCNETLLRILAHCDGPISAGETAGSPDLVLRCFSPKQPALDRTAHQSLRLRGGELKCYLLTVQFTFCLCKVTAIVPFTGRAFSDLCDLWKVRLYLCTRFSAYTCPPTLLSACINLQLLLEVNLPQTSASAAAALQHLCTVGQHPHASLSSAHFCLPAA